MKRVSATEARKTWFQILDEAAAGEVFMIERKGRRLLLQRELGTQAQAEVIPDYSVCIRPLASLEMAEQWSWEWTGSDDDLAARSGSAR